MSNEVELKAFDLATAESLLYSDEKFSVDFDKLWRWCGYKRKDNAKRTLLRIFVQGEDYIITKPRYETGTDNHLGCTDYESLDTQQKAAMARVEYIHMTVEAAKHMALTAQTDKGHDVRTYFIRAEEKLRSLSRKPTSTLEYIAQVEQMMQMAKQAEYARLEAEAEAARRRAEAAAAERQTRVIAQQRDQFITKAMDLEVLHGGVCEADMPLSEYGSFIQSRKKGTPASGPTRIFQYLQAKGWLYQRRTGAGDRRGRRRPTSDAIDMGRLKKVETSYLATDSNIHESSFAIYITQKGREQLLRCLFKDGFLTVQDLDMLVEQDPIEVDV